jgi:hypothetical protein
MNTPSSFKFGGGRTCLQRARVFFRTLRHLLGLILISAGFAACGADPAILGPDTDCAPLARMLDRAVASCALSEPLFECERKAEEDPPRRDPKHAIE